MASGEGRTLFPPRPGGPFITPTKAFMGGASGPFPSVSVPVP